MLSYINGYSQRTDLFKIDDFLYGKTFETPDTVVAISFSGDSFVIGISQTNMSYTMSFLNKTGTLIYIKTITYQDLFNAALKSGISTNNIPNFLQTIQQAMVSGSLATKIAYLNEMLNFYGVKIKSVNLQNGVFEWD